MVSSTTTEWTVGSSQYNEVNRTQLIIRNMSRLRRIVTGSNCFGSVRLFELNGLFELENVVIGQKSFTIEKTGDIWNSKRTDGTCRIKNCPKLVSIQIGVYSFGDYSSSFELSNLPSLQSIDIGGSCFLWAPVFSLTRLID